MQSTQHYIDNEKNFISKKSTQPTEVIEFKTCYSAYGRAS